MPQHFCSPSLLSFWTLHPLPWSHLFLCILKKNPQYSTSLLVCILSTLSPPVFQKVRVSTLRDCASDLVPNMPHKEPQKAIKIAVKLLSRDHSSRHHCHHLPHVLTALWWETVGMESFSRGFTIQSPPVLQLDTCPAVQGPPWLCSGSGFSCQSSAAC